MRKSSSIVPVIFVVSSKIGMFGQIFSKSRKYEILQKKIRFPISGATKLVSSGF
jgi:hypothetical protein